MNMRSRIEMRWSTDPSDMGYGNAPAPSKLPGRPAYVGSPRTVLAEVARVRQNVGQGTYIRVEYRNRGRVVQGNEIEDIVNQHDR